jgi:hypothetical protein
MMAGADAAWTRGDDDVAELMPPTGDFC